MSLRPDDNRDPKRKRLALTCTDALLHVLVPRITGMVGELLDRFSHRADFWKNLPDAALDPTNGILSFVAGTTLFEQPSGLASLFVRPCYFKLAKLLLLKGTSGEGHTRHKR